MVRPGLTAFVLSGWLGGVARAEPEPSPPSTSASHAADPDPARRGQAENPAPKPPEPSLADELHGLAASMQHLADLTAVAGANPVSRETEQLASGVETAAAYAELAALLVGANPPTAYAAYASIRMGGGVERSPAREAASELTVAVGATVSGPTCALFEGAAEAELALPIGPSLSESAKLCLGGFRPDPTRPIEAVAVRAYEAVGLNVRPSVDSAAVLDSTRFAMAEAGLSAEGMRWYSGNWSLAALWVSLGQGFLTQKVGSDRHNLAHVTGVAWFGEARYHRGLGALTDGAIRLFPIAIDEVEAGQVLGTISLVPLELVGIGSHGVYVDAAGGLDVTTSDPGDHTAAARAKPNLAIGSYRLALRLGGPWLHLELVARGHLLPTLNGAVVSEDRQSASLHGDLGLVTVDGSLYQAHSQLFTDGVAGVDQELDAWAGQGAAWLRLAHTWVIGGSLEIGRAFAFGDPGADLTTLAAPAFGYRALLEVGWGVTQAEAMK